MITEKIDALLVTVHDYQTETVIKCGSKPLFIM